MKTVAIVEHSEDVRALSETIGYSNRDLVIISTQPAASWELGKRHIHYKDIREFYDCRDFYLTGMENYSRIMDLCTRIDAHLAQNHPLLQKYHLAPAMDNFYFIKMLYDNLSLRLLLLQSILAKESPVELMAFAPGDLHPAGPAKSIPFTRNDSVFGMLLSLDCWPCRNTVIRRSDIPLPHRTVTQRMAESSLRARIRTDSLFASTILRRARSMAQNKAGTMYGRIASFVRNPKERPVPLLLLGNSHWTALSPQLAKNGFTVIATRKEVSPFDHHLGNGGSCMSVENLETILAPFCNFRSIDFTSIAAERILPLLSRYINSVPGGIAHIEGILQKHAPMAVLSGEKGSFEDHIWLHVCRYHGIPALSWQHGDGPFYPPMQVFVEIMNSDYHLCYGEGHRALLSRAPQNIFSSKIVSVGSLLLEEIYKASCPQNRSLGRVLYVTTNYYHNNLYVNNFPTVDTDLWKTQQDILIALGQSGHPVTLKLFPEVIEEEFLFEFLDNPLFSNITPVKGETSFRDLLSSHDIIVCDYPSTPVIESIAAGKIVFVLLNYPFWNEDALPSLKKRVFWSGKRREFILMIQEYLKGKTLSQVIDLCNREYLERFGVHRLDGMVGDRAIAVIREAISAYPQQISKEVFSLQEND